MIMGKTKRSNRVKGGKTRKYWGGEDPLTDNAEITIQLYLHEKKLYLKPPKVSKLSDGAWKKTLKLVKDFDSNKYQISNDGKSIATVLNEANISKKITLGDAWTSASASGTESGNSVTRKSVLESSKNLEIERKKAIKKLTEVIKLFKDNVKSRFGRSNADFGVYADELIKITSENIPNFNINSLTTLTANLGTVKLNRGDPTKLGMDYGNNPTITIKDATKLQEFLKFLVPPP